MTAKITTKNLLAVFGALTIISFVLISFFGYQRASASVQITQEYTATSTATSNIYGATINSGITLIRTGQGSIGSVVITGAAAGVLNFYDATTSDVTKRASQFASSSILIASLPASLAAGTYVFDSQYNYGLLVVLSSGTMPTSTITYR